MSSSLLSAGKREFTAEPATKEFFRVAFKLKRQMREEQEKHRESPYPIQSYLTTSTLTVSSDNIPGISPTRVFETEGRKGS